MDPKTKKYIHLIDGGVSDNLGIRMGLDRVAAIGGMKKAHASTGQRIPDHLVFVIVNAETEPDPRVDLNAKAPSLAASLNLVSGSQIRRYNFESLLLAREALANFVETLSTPEHPVTGHFIEVSFDLIDDYEERRYFKRLPTSFKLSDEQVDRLRDAGRTILTESPEFLELLGSLN
jgi:NTE family protein